jgi:thiamine pyrophosphate-dependent acetolactate synthase large subunit-like protein
MTTLDRQPLNRREVVARLLADRGDLVVIAGLGASAYDVAATGGSPLDFPLWGAMGGAAMVGLGVALARPDRRVVVITGDGEMLMGLGSLATIGAQRPANLAIVVLDNGRFGETGNQPTHTAMGTDLAQVARACGITAARTITDMAEVTAFRAHLHDSAGPLLAVVKIGTEAEAKALPPRDGPFLAHRLRAALVGSDRALDD